MYKTLLSCMIAGVAFHGLMAAPEEQDVVELEPLNVTAHKRREPFKDVSLSLKSLSMAQLEDARVMSVGDLADITPNFKFYSAGSRRTALFYMRGIGSSGPNQPAVGFFVDDIYYAKTGFSDLELHDLERIEVLRGPQSTLYGRNTEAGVVHVVTRKPDNQAAYSLEQTLGKHNLSRTGLRLRGPLVRDRLFYSLSGALFKRDGFTNNDLLDERVDDQDQLSGRLKLRSIMESGLEATFSLYADRDRDGGYPMTSLEENQRRPFHVRHNLTGRHERDLWIASLHLDVPTPVGDLVSVTAYTDWENEDAYDQDFTAADLFRLLDKDTLQGFSQELRLASLETGSPWTWLVGIHYFNNNTTDTNLRTFGADAGMIGATPGMQEHRPLDIEDWGLAQFGRVTYAVRPNSKLTAGVRFEHQEKEANGSTYYTVQGQPAGPALPEKGALDYDELLPEAEWSHRWSEQLMHYVRVACGFRVGGFNNNDESAPATYEPELVWNYELGMKSTLADNRLEINAALFLMQIKDQQLIQFKPGGTGFFFKNVGDVESRGAELDMRAKPFAGVEFDAGVGFVDATFQDAGDPVLGEDYDGNRVPFAPRLSYHASAQVSRNMRQDLSLFGRAQVHGYGDTVWNEANTVESEGYALVDARVGMGYRMVDISLFADNLFDKEYQAVVFAFPNANPLTEPGAPRTFGVTMSVAF